MTISTRDLDFIRLCLRVREASHDPHRKVGAVIVDPSGRKIAEGANAPPAVLGLTVAQSHQAIGRDPRWKYFVLEHAERNAIFTAYRDRAVLAGSTMYVTLYPCADCARAIVAAGISRLVVLGLPFDPERDEKWRDHYLHAKTVLELANLSVEIVGPEAIDLSSG